CMETQLDHRRSACSNFINKVRSRPAQPAGFILSAQSAKPVRYSINGQALPYPNRFADISSRFFSTHCQPPNIELPYRDI
ncbi:hypothetical protein, partial [Aeromonas hydrophila]|uniref:hypothetical protein n=1 Tax=Aeromonas hydrophila TaxID=644 RepID=UPI002B48041B